VLRWIVPDANPAGAVYGLVTIGALLAAESDRRESYAEAVASTALAVLLYWFAHAYSDLLGRRLSQREPLTAHALGWAFVRDWAIVRGAGVPLAALVFCWALGAPQTTAVSVALWTSVACIVAFEMLAGLRSRARPLELVLDGCAGAAMGMAIIALRVLLH